MAPALEPSSTPPPHAPLVLGPPIIGVTLNWFLYGILVMQYFMYLNNNTKDKKWLRATVHFLMALDTAQTLMAMDDIFYWYVYNFGNYSALLEFNIATIDGPFLDALIMITVQLVYCWRVWVLGRWRVVPIIASFLAFVSCACGMFIGINDIIVDPITATRFKPVELTWLFASAVTDVMIACSMAYLLLKYRQEKSSRSTMSLVKRILLLTLETNAVTAALAIALITAFLVTSIEPPKTNVYMPIGYIIGKMYSNCFMVLLNQRIYYEKPTKTSVTMNSLSGASDLGRIQQGAQNQTTGSISMIRFNESRTMMDTRTAIESNAGAKDGQDSMKSVPSGDYA
ncbi:hypothetical protein D9756_009064 [Leucocoprinus leucothites]|uniref:DUF6534 domain-containing protein n=1 Tax=Leucocoprinus leucothites TaxID=201217 RepID=A0A8H5CZQ6_9AGAR|nr:hypothetical protein D9756_009064 [Leucoagaricus leucothites]